MMNILSIIYWIVSFLIALLCALTLPSTTTGGYDKLPKLQKIRKFVEQFAGSAVGFFVFYYLLRKGWYMISTSQFTLFGFWDILLLIIAMLGIVGFLSGAVYGISTNIVDILKAHTKQS